MESKKLKHRDNSWKYWISTGIAWGLLMLISMELVYPIVTGEELILKKILNSIPIWLIGGLVFGSIMKFYMNQRDKK